MLHVLYCSAQMIVLHKRLSAYQPTCLQVYSSTRSTPANTYTQYLVPAQMIRLGKRDADIQIFLYYNFFLVLCVCYLYVFFFIDADIQITHTHKTRSAHR